MNIILLSGGSGKRLWPLSNDVRSKQFIKFLEDENGNKQSMVQRVFSQINRTLNPSTLTIATSKTQVSAIRNQLSGKYDVCIEPCRRDTFPAIALSCAYLKDVLGVKRDECVIVCPVDPYVDDNFFVSMKELEYVVNNKEANMALLGIKPDCPSEKYGYIIPESSNKISKVLQFKEKPTAEVAETYLKQNALWNAGVFAFKLGYLLDKAHQLIDFVDYVDLFNKYEKLNKISFDYAVVENEKEISVVQYNGQWKDIGTWNMSTEVMKSNVVGEGTLEKCENTHIVNELDVPVIGVGLDNVVISVGPDGILVSNKDLSEGIKKIVDNKTNVIMFAEKSWGQFQVINHNKTSLTILNTINTGKAMSYHYHNNRSEVWIVLEGSGMVVINDELISVSPGSVVQIPIGAKHTIKSITPLKTIEIQIGDEINKSDKIKVDENQRI